MMAPHHLHAIEMAEILRAQGADAELQAMANAMIQKQESEIAELATKRRGC